MIGAGIVQVFPYLRLDLWVGARAVLAMAYITFAAFGAGFFAGRRGWLAGALSALVGALLYAVAAALLEPGSDPGAFVFFLLRIPLAVFPFILLGGLAGWLGGLVRSRAVPAAR